MSAMVPVNENDELKILGNRIMEMLRDSRSDARRVGRIVDLVPGLASAMRTTAEILVEGRGRVANTAHAIILIGYRRVEQVLPIAGCSLLPREAGTAFAGLGHGRGRYHSEVQVYKEYGY